MYLRLITLAVASLTALSGCMTSPLKVVSCPKPPEVLLQPPPGLSSLPDNPQLTDLARVIVDNYGAYYSTKTELEALQEWAKLVGK